MYEKIKFAMSQLATFLWPFIKQFLTAEGKVVTNAAVSAVKQIAADPTMEGRTWQEKLSAAVAIAGSDIAKQSISVGTTAIINAVQAAYTVSQTYAVATK